MTQIASISQQIWDMKYRLKGPGGEVMDKTIDDSWRRIANALAEAEPKDKEAWADVFFEAMHDFRFLPAGRIVVRRRHRPQGHLVQLLRHGRHPRRYGRHLRASEGSRRDHAARRRHRL